ncbi:MAG: serine hydrolase [Ekhidna sp.]
MVKSFQRNLKLRIVCISISFLITSCHVGRFVAYNAAGINDYKKFPQRTIDNDTSIFKFYENAYKQKTLTELNSIKNNFEDYLSNHGTVAFIIIQNDTVKYEQYFNNYNRSSIVSSFSIAKSLTSLLIGCAIDDGLIKSTEEYVVKYIPELSDRNFENVTIEHLLQMTSGLKSKESYYNPFGDAAQLYYGKDLRKFISKLRTKSDPGESYNYVSGNTQLLGLVLERALNGKSVSQYLEEKLWKNLGMEYDASWSIDRKENGLEKTFCCVNARAIDYAKIGRLVLNKGNWNGNQIISADWVSRSVKRDHSNGSSRNYQYQWYTPYPNGDFMARGILGQYLFISPSKSLIIVRLGEKEGNGSWLGLFEMIRNHYWSFGGWINR